MFLRLENIFTSGRSSLLPVMHLIMKTELQVQNLMDVVRHAVYDSH